MDDRSVRFKVDARQEDNCYSNLDSARGNSVVYDEINVGTDGGVVSILTRNGQQSGNNQEQGQRNDTNEQNEPFLVHRRTVKIVVSILVVVVGAQIATCCFVGFYIANASTDSPTNVQHRGSVDSKTDPHANTSQTVSRYWSVWSSWNSCSVTCGTGLQKRERTCVNPNPDSSGEWCTGESVEYEICSSNACKDIATAFTVTDPNSRVNDYLIFAEVISNIGEAFNNNTGIFTCSYPGLYVFSLSLVKKSYHAGVDIVRCALFKNGDYILEGYVYHKDNGSHKGDAYASHTAVIHLTTGDIVGLQKCSDPSTSMEYWTTFSGFLLHPDA